MSSVVSKVAGTVVSKVRMYRECLNYKNIRRHKDKVYNCMYYRVSEYGLNK